MAKPAKLTSLVYLIFAPNTCYCQVVAKRPRDVALDLENNKYTLTSSNAGYKQSQTFKIGDGRSYFDGKYGTIGVFDKGSAEHLDTMVHLAIEAVRERHHSDG